MPFAIHNHLAHEPTTNRLLIAGQDLWEADGQVRIAAVGGHEQGMTGRVMQQHQGTTAFDHAIACDQATRQSFVGVDRFAMPINIDGEGRDLGIRGGGQPELGGPLGERVVRASAAPAWARCARKRSTWR